MEGAEPLVGRELGRRGQAWIRRRSVGLQESCVDPADEARVADTLPGRSLLCIRLEAALVAHLARAGRNPDQARRGGIRCMAQVEHLAWSDAHDAERLFVRVLLRRCRRRRHCQLCRGGWRLRLARDDRRQREDGTRALPGDRWRHGARHCSSSRAVGARCRTSELSSLQRFGLRDCGHRRLQVGERVQRSVQADDGGVATRVCARTRAPGQLGPPPPGGIKGGDRAAT
jgi:hypothetical protein